MRPRTIFTWLARIGFAGLLSLACGSGGSSGGGVPGLDAATATIGFPQKCEACIGAMCASQFEACWSDSACMVTEICTGKCIEKEGKSPLACSTVECQSDSGIVSALDMCITGFCATPCGT